MDKSSIQILLSHLLELAKKEHIGPLHVCWYEGQPQIKPQKHTKVKHHIFMNLTYVHRSSGLTGREWDEVTNKIFNHIKELQKCQKLSEL